MDDLHERLQQIERNPSPNLWDEIVDRHEQPIAPEPAQRVRHRVAAGLVAAVVSIAALALLFSMFGSEDEQNTLGTPATPIKIKVWYGEVPHIEASYEGVVIPLDSIETPGSELELPTTQAPMELPTGTPIEIESLNYAETTSVFRLEPASGELVPDGACIVPGALRLLPGPGTSAFFIFVEWPWGTAGMGFRAETAGEAIGDDSALDPNSTVDASKLGLTNCNDDLSLPAGEFETFVAALRDGGRTVRASSEQPLLTDAFVVDGSIVHVDGERVYAFEYPSEAAFNRMQGRISENGDQVGDTVLFWSPHFFGEGRLIVVVLGQNEETLRAVESVLGPQFAGV